MPQEINVPMIAKILNDEMVFKDQEVPYTDRKTLQYEIVALDSQHKQVIKFEIEEVTNLVNQIIDEVSAKENFIKFFEILYGEKATIFFSKYQIMFIKKYNDAIKQAVGEGGSSGTYKLLNNDGSITNKSLEIKYYSFDDFMEKMYHIKTLYLNYLNKIKNLSVQEILNKMGYDSVEDMGIYYQKFLELTTTPEYKDFFVEKKGGSLLAQSGNLDIFSFLIRDLNFLFEIKEVPGAHYWMSSTPIGMDIFSRRDFLILDKHRIDNFIEIVNSYKINVESNSLRSEVPTHFYFDPNEEDKTGKHESFKNFISREERDPYGYRGVKTVNIIVKYYEKMKDYSYDNGLYFSYFKFVDENITIPTYSIFLERYNKFVKAYNLNDLEVIPLDLFKNEILNSKLIKQSYYTPGGPASDLFKVIISKETVLKLPIEEITKKIKLEILKETKEKKEINIDDILKNIDSEFKNIDNTIVSGYLGLKNDDIEGIKQKLLQHFDGFILQKIKIITNKGFSNSLFSGDQKFLNEHFGEEQENIEEKKVDIKKVLSKEDIRLLSMQQRFIDFNTNNPKLHSYKESLNKIEKYLDFHKNKILTYINTTSELLYSESYNKYFLKNISINSIDTFFNNLKKILVKQLQQEEMFLQSKSDSRGIIDELKFENNNIKDLPLNIALLPNMTNISSAIYYEIENTNNGIFNIFDSFDDQIFKNFDHILKYFSIFPDEAMAFFNLDDFNQIKNSIVKIFNFINSNKNYEKLKQIPELIGNIGFTSFENKITTYSGAADELQKRMDFLPHLFDQREFYRYRDSGEEPKFESYSDYLEKYREISNSQQEIKQNSHSGVEFLVNFFKNKSFSTKKDKIEKIIIISQLMHNYSSNYEYLNLLLNSKYFEKAYNKSIFEVLNFVGTSFNEAKNSLEILNTIKEKNPKLIPEEYLTENITYCIANIENIKSSNDLDDIIEKLLLGDYSENIKRFKYLMTIITQYSSTVEWMRVAVPKVEDVFAPNFSTEQFRFRVLGDLDPYHFRVGVDTGCCQAIGGQGASAAIDSFINPKAGVVLLEVKEDSRWSLAAQSYFHYAEMQEENSAEKLKAIILDNIEAGSFLEIYEEKFGKDFYPKAYAVLGSYLKDKGFNIVGCGKEFTYVFDESKFDMSSLRSDPRHFEITKHGKKYYTDFNSNYFFNLLNPKFSFEMPNDINSIETEMTIKSARILDLCIQKNGNKKAMSLNKLSKTLLTFGFKKEAADLYKIIAISLT